MLLRFLLASFHYAGFVTHDSVDTSGDDEEAADCSDDADADDEGWSPAAIRDLCQIHIPILEQYEGEGLTFKRNHWRKMMEIMNSKGYTGKAFDKPSKLSKKWRYIFSKFKKVKHINSREGCKKMPYKHFDILSEFFNDTNSSNAPSSPIFTEPAEQVTLSPSRSSATRKEKTHDELMREMQERYNNESLRLQREALEIEREKVELLRQLVNKMK